MSSDNFEIKLPQFEGPFDLLLFFIERDELDIQEISIAQIADEFLSYLQQMNSLNIELASEFIVVAATLMRIKAKMLLPRYEPEIKITEADTQEDLIRKLIAYKQFKDVCEQLRVLEGERFKQQRRGNITTDLILATAAGRPGEELTHLNLYRLMQVYKRVNDKYLSRDAEPVTHTVLQYPYTIEQQKKQITNLLQINGRMDYRALLANSEDKVHFVYNFLAMLEMLQQELIDIQIGSDYNNFWIAAKTPK